MGTSVPYGFAQTLWVIYMLLWREEQFMTLIYQHYCLEDQVAFADRIS